MASEGGGNKQIGGELTTGHHIGLLLPTLIIKMKKDHGWVSKKREMLKGWLT